MRVATDELLVEAARHVVDVELAGVGGHLRMEEHLLEHVAKLLAKVSDVVGIDGVDRLVSLLNHIHRDGGVSLLAVPGAAIGLAQAPDGTDKPVELRVRRRGVGARRVLLVHEVREGAAIRHATLRLVELARHELHLLPFPLFSAVIVSRGLRTFRLRATPRRARGAVWRFGPRSLGGNGAPGVRQLGLCDARHRETRHGRQNHVARGRKVRSATARA